MAQKNTTSENNETFGKRIARFRKEQGLTQVDLGEKIGLSQVLISDYERGRLQPNLDTIIKLARTLGLTTDELLGVNNIAPTGKKLSLKSVRRLKKIEDLPHPKQKVLFQTIDTFLKGAGQ
jgi:transcriptional regulator with XRE-family HTH domain